MSKLMWVLGILLAAAGVALGLMTTLMPGRMQAYGVLPDTAAILLVGGILSLGLGGVINALKGSNIRSSNSAVSEMAPEADKASNILTPAKFGRRSTDNSTSTANGTAVAAGAVIAAGTAAVAETSRSSVADTLTALDEAKADIKKALGGMDSLSTPEEHYEPAAASVAVSSDEHANAKEISENAPSSDPELFVVEEKIVRGRPARILSDDTVEAETDEGWMRFENLEHLNEYLDSTEEPDA